MRHFLLAFLFFVTLVPSDLTGQGIRKGNGVGRQGRRLSTWHATVGSDARRTFAKYGITLGSNGAKVEHVYQPPPINITPRPEPPYIRNTPPEGSQADIPLVIDFRFPVRYLYFTSFSYTQGTTAKVSAFNAEGGFLGTLEYDFSVGPEVEIEALAPERISKLIVKFEGPQKDEELRGEWWVAFVKPPVFTTVLPQVGDGRLSEDRSLSTRFTILNLSNTIATGEVRFYDPLGQPLEVPVDSPVPGQNKVSTYPLELRANESLTFVTHGNSAPPLSGYAVVESIEPVQATVHFRTLRGALILSEVSAASAVPRYSVKGSFERYGGWEDNLPGGQQTTHINTGVGIVNTSDQSAKVVIGIVEREGTGAVHSSAVQLFLSPREQYSRFISEIFSSLAAQSWGVISVSSDQPLGVTLIRTGDGVPLSILPLGSLEEE